MDQRPEKDLNRKTPGRELPGVFFEAAFLADALSAESLIFILYPLNA